MTGNEVAIIEFGTSKVTVIIARRGANNTFDILGFSEGSYVGYHNGSWVEEENLSDIISKVICECENKAKLKIKTIYVGVPGEFTIAIQKEVSMSFKTPQKVTDSVMEALYQSGMNFADYPEYNPINQSPEYFILDNGLKIINPKNQKTCNISGKVSYILAEKYFIDSVQKALFACNVAVNEFLSCVLCQTMFLFEPEERDKYVLFCDIGFGSTTVVLGRGDAVLYMKSFAMGGGYIDVDLSTHFNIPFTMSDKLKRKVRLSLNVSSLDTYEVVENNARHGFICEEIHKIVLNRLKEIAHKINICIAGCPIQFPDTLQLNITGGGVSYIAGVASVLSEFLGGRACQIVMADIPFCDKPQLSSEYALLDSALNRKQSKPNLLKKLFGVN